eukprot:1187533-Prorocentrum_minimum.AAC.4
MGVGRPCWMKKDTARQLSVWLSYYALAAAEEARQLRGANPLFAFLRTLLPWVNLDEVNEEELAALAEQLLADTGEGLPGNILGDNDGFAAGPPPEQQ